MQRVGTVSRVTQGLVIVRCPGADHPDIGAQVVGEDLATVGRVVDVFGPVDRPYVAITTAEGATPASLVGAKLYAR